eukprot:748369-Hanusia_phi.AAC.1
MDAVDNILISFDDPQPDSDFLQKVSLPLCFSADAFHCDTTSAYPCLRLNDLDLDIKLVPTLGVVFKDVNGNTRNGIIREVRERSICAYILYNKETLLEVSGNLKMNAQTMRMIRSLEVFECFQSLYTDEFPVEDVIGTFKLNYQPVSMRASSWTSFLPACFGNQIDLFQLGLDLRKLRTEMEKWFHKRGEPFLKPHVKRVEFDVDHDEISSLLLMLLGLRSHNPSVCWSQGS